MSDYLSIAVLILATCIGFGLAIGIPMLCMAWAERITRSKR